MRYMIAPLQIATIANTLVWPLAAGAAVVLWSWTRARARRRTAMQDRLQSSYREVESQPTPETLALVLEALEEGEELAPDGKAGAAAPRTPEAR